MKKSGKILIISLAILLSCFCSFNFSNSKQKISVQKLSYATGYIPEETFELNTELVKLSEDINYATTNLEASYNLADEIYIQVENQQDYGLCYAFSCLNMFETYLAKQFNEYYDFSEIHFATATPDTNGTSSTIDFINGGNFQDLQTYIYKGLGPVLEEEMPYEEFYNASNPDSMEKLAKDFFLANQDNFTNLISINQLVKFANRSQLTKEEQILENRNNIKAHLKTYSSVITSIYSTDVIKSNGVYYLPSTNNDTANHMVTIVGWDDNIQLGNYTGGYLCLNSWGENWGNNGYFYIPYENSLVENTCYGVTDIGFNSDSQISNLSNRAIYDKYNDVLSSSISISNNTSCYADVIDVSNYQGRTIDSLEVGYLANGDYSFRLEFRKSLPSTSNFSQLLNDSTKGLNINSITLVPYYEYSESTNVFANFYGTTLAKATLAETVTIPEDANYAILLTLVKDFHDMICCRTDKITDTTDANYFLNNSFCYTSDGFTPSYYSNYSLNAPIIFNLVDIYGINKAEFETKKACTINGKEIQNALYWTNSLTLTLNTDLAISNIKVLKFSVTNSNYSFTEILTDDITTTKTETGNQKTIKLTQNSSNLALGNYVLQFKVGDKTLEKAFSVITPPETIYEIEYVLNDGVNSSLNATNFTATQTELKLYNPTKTGYNFKGWFLDEKFETQPSLTQSNATGSDTNGEYVRYSLTNITSNIKLYAKWELKNITINTQPTGVEKTYDKIAYCLIVEASHELADLNYQWYYHATSTDKADFSIVTEGNSNSINLINSKQSGNYFCLISSNINGQALESSTNVVTIKINKGIYDIGWDYSSAFNYNNKEKEIKLTNLDKYSGDIELLELTGNKKTNAGNYTASAIFKNLNENYEDFALENLNWTINPSTLTIKISDYSKTNQEEFDNFTIANCESQILSNIYDSYSPILSFTITNTNNANLKTINAVCTNPNSNYDIEIVAGNLKFVRQTLSLSTADYTISVYNQEGFLADSELLVEVLKPQQITSSVQKQIEDKDLIVYNIYSVNVADNPDGNKEFSISLSPDLADKNIKLYLIGENGITQVDSSIADNKISFNSENFGTFLIVEAPVKTDTKIVVLTLVIILFAGLLCCLTITLIRHHRKKKYNIKTKDFIVH